MKLKILGSGSSGNCYILSNEKEALIIEAGINFNEVKKALDYNISKVVACLISHEHQDHCSEVNKFLDASIDVYCSPGTMHNLNLKSKRFPLLLNTNKWVKFGNFTVFTFKTQHDAEEPNGFVIYHPETGNILFATDTSYIPIKFNGLNNIIIEANYDNNIIDRKCINDDISLFLRNRIIDSHLSIQATVDYLKSIDLSKVANIILIHLSDPNSNEKEFKSFLENATGKNVIVADKGIEVNINKTPF